METAMMCEPILTEPDPEEYAWVLDQPVADLRADLDTGAFDGVLYRLMELEGAGRNRATARRAIAARIKRWLEDE